MLTGPLNLPAPGRRQSVYINFHVFARTCVFNKQSLPSLLCDHHQLKTRWSPVMVPLLPKLRGHFAEFLNHSSPARLSIFYLTTCVGYGYGPCTHIARGFSRQHRITSIPTQCGYASRLTYKTRDGFTYPAGYTLTPQSNQWPSYQSVSPHRLTTTNQGPTHPDTNHHKHDDIDAQGGWLV